MRQSFLKRLFVTLSFGSTVALQLVGCGPTVKSQLPAGGSVPASVALLPSDYSVGIPRERINLVRQALINELRNSHFVVLDDSATNSLCSSPQCPERSELVDRYLVDGFVTLQLSSFSRNNFVAGYYNQLSGEVSVTDRSGKQLVSVQQVENEEGGLLLQSGQLFEAILSSVKNTGDEVFETLADKFARSVVEQIPPPSTTTDRFSAEGAAVALSSATATWVSPTTYRLCAQGTPHSFAYLVTAKTKTNLRETKPGTYCGNFSGLVHVATGQQSTVELRSAFGTSVRQSVSLPSMPPCDLQNRVRAEEGRVKVLCASIGSATGVDCSGGLSVCSAEKIVLFRASSPTGPFEKLSEARSATSAIPASEGAVVVLAVGAGGVPSLPVKVESKKEAAQ